MNKKIKFNNSIFNKNELKNVIYKVFTDYGITKSCSLADDLKDLGFKFATKAGISISIEDLKIPPTKTNLILSSTIEIEKSTLSYLRGEITSVERFQKIIDTWNKTSEILKNDLIEYFGQTDPLNSIYLMAFSGARGNISQVRQLVGMRGLMSDPNGQIIDIPIIHNFREGLTITDYIMSAYGARKGVVDTSLRTADSGYLTRRLVYVAQNVIIRETNCFTKRSIKVYKKENKLSYLKKIIGRTIAETIYIKKKLFLEKDKQITPNIAQILLKNRIYNIKLHSPLTCEAIRSICQKCYGWNLVNEKLVSLGEAIGIMAAQSIGEPGTQLTMRTFHTGGIFTSNPSLQIRAKNSGFFSFSTDIQKKPSRTIYGSNISILERESKFLIIDYKNLKNELKLPADSSLFIKNKNFVRKNDLIAELSLKNRHTIKSKKYIRVQHAGEIQFLSDSSIVWILKGEVYTIPYNSIFNKFILNQKIYNNDNLVYFKVIAKKEGILNIIKNKITKQIEFLKIIKDISFFNFSIFWDSQIKKIIIKQNNNKFFILNKKNKNLINDFNLATEYNPNYTTETGGQILYPKYSLNIENTNQFITKNQKILIITSEIHTINNSKLLLLIPDKTKLAVSGLELIPGIVSKIAGFLQIKEFNNILQEIIIKPGNIYEYLRLDNLNLIRLKKLNQRIYFPGEVIFEDILIQYLTIIEIIRMTRTSYSILLRPIEIYNIPKPINLSKIISLINQTTKLKYTTLLNYKFEIIENVGNLIESNIKLKKKEVTDLENKNFKIFIIMNLIKNSILGLAIMSEQIIGIPNFFAKKLTDKSIKLGIILKDFEYTEPQILISLIFIKLEIEIKIKNFKISNKNNKNINIIFINPNNYNTYVNDDNSFIIKKNNTLRIKDKIGPLIKTNHSGQVLSNKAFKFVLHSGTPFFITVNTSIYKKSNEFIMKNEILGIIYFEKIVTEDIVQGLPKVEEILEAQQPKNSADLAQLPCVFKAFDKNKKAKYISISMNKKSIIIKKNDYLYLGQAITKGSVNPHDLLIIYFNYYTYFFNNYEATYLSFKNIQLLLIQKVQQVYNSQGVSIADKHIELIIRQITSKIQINYTNINFFLVDEIFELNQIKYINMILKKSFKSLVSYSPILIGITKASLLTESFISGSCFQETTKILTTAAIEGKIDWLRGLKENIILGRLVPIGSGLHFGKR